MMEAMYSNCYFFKPGGAGPLVLTVLVPLKKEEKKETHFAENSHPQKLFYFKPRDMETTLKCQNVSRNCFPLPFFKSTSVDVRLNYPLMFIGHSWSIGRIMWISRQLCSPGLSPALPSCIIVSGKKIERCWGKTENIILPFMWVWCNWPRVTSHWAPGWADFQFFLWETLLVWWSREKAGSS